MRALLLGFNPLRSGALVSSDLRDGAQKDEAVFQSPS